MGQERWGKNQGVLLHYLDSAGDAGQGVPLLYVPGMIGSAADFADEFAAFAPRRSLSLSLRGRGKSDSPETGYSFGDHVADLEAVVKDAGLEPFCILAFSRGVAYSLEFAARYPEMVKGLILLDAPAVYPRFSEEWAERAMEKFAGVAEEHAVRGLQRESEEISLWERLPLITCPVRIVRGGQSNSLLNEEMAHKYVELLPDCEVVVFEDSGHELWVPDYQRFISVVQEFLQKIDGGDKFGKFE